jgi:iron complex transport system substrate-binding protein
MVRRIVFSLMMIALLTGSAAAQGDSSAVQENITDGCVESYDPSVDYFPQKVTVSDAEGFQISYYNNYKVIRIDQPYLNAGIRFEYVLVQCGTSLPEVVEGVETIGYQVIEVPIQSVVALSTPLFNVEAIGELDALVAVDGPDVVRSEAARARIDAGELVEVGTPATLDSATVRALDPDLILLTVFFNTDLDAVTLLRDEGIPYAPIGDYLELSPLGRAEWIKFTAAFFNREAEANSVFSEIESVFR